MSNGTTISADWVLSVLARECRNGCTDYRDAFDYFKKRYPSLREEDSRKLVAILRIVNFSALRENDGVIYETTSLHGESL